MFDPFGSESWGFSNSFYYRGTLLMMGKGGGEGSKYRTRRHLFPRVTWKINEHLINGWCDWTERQEDMDGDPPSYPNLIPCWKHSFCTCFCISRHEIPSKKPPCGRQKDELCFFLISAPLDLTPPRLAAWTEAMPLIESFEWSWNLISQCLTPQRLLSAQIH